MQHQDTRDADGVALAFLQTLIDDRARGTTRTLEDYQARYPGYEDVIARSWTEAVAPSDDTAEGEPEARYARQDVIGAGGMGDVYRAWDRALDRPVAMKVLRAGGDAARPQNHRFFEEARITARLAHPGIVAVHDVGRDDGGQPYFTMTMVRGESLREVIQRLHAGDGEWSQPRVLGVLLRVCDAVSYAHDRGVLHRDLKPSNVMVGRFGEVFVMDWGLARLTGEGAEAVDGEPPATDAPPPTPDPGWRLATPTMTGDVIGTPGYMAPEQARGDLAQLAPTTDVYAIGAMLYHVLAGRMPHALTDGSNGSGEVLARVVEGPPEPLHRAAPGVPDELVAICERAMARAPDQRYRSAAELADDLRAFLEVRVVRAYGGGAFAQLGKWVRRNRLAAIALGVAILATATGIGVAAGFQRDAEQRLELAFEAVDRMLRRVGENDLRDVPQAAVVRRDVMRDAIEFLQRLLDDQDDHRVRRRLARMHYELAVLLLRQGDGGAWQELEQSLIHHDEVLRQFADEVYLLGSRETARAAMARVHLAGGRRDEAAALSAEVVTNLRALAERFPREVLVVESLAQQTHNHSVILSTGGQHEAALRAQQDAVAAYREVTAREPTEARRRRLAKVQGHLALALTKAGHPEDALRHYEDNVQTLRELLEADSGDRGTRNTLTITLLNYCTALVEAGEADRATEAATEAATLAEGLASDFPDDFTHRNDLGLAHSRLSAHATRRGDWHGAARHAVAAEAAHRAVQSAKNPEYTRLWVKALQVAIHSHERIADHAAVADHVERLFNIDPSPKESWNAARVLARNLPVAARSDEAAAAVYRERALQHLRRAIEAGYKNRQLLDHPHFEPLRSAPEFDALRKLVANR